MTPLSVQLVIRGDGENSVSVPGRKVRWSRPAQPVGYATDPKRHLSSTPSTLIAAVAGVADRTGILSMASLTGR